MSAAMSATGTLWIVVLMILINSDVIGRAVFNQPISGVPELVTLSIIGIVFLQLPHTTRSGGLTRTDAAQQWIRPRAPLVAALLNAVFAIAGAAIFCILAYVEWNETLNAWRTSDYIGNPGILIVPTAPIHGLIFLGAAGVAIQLVLEAVNSLRRRNEGE